MNKLIELLEEERCEIPDSNDDYYIGYNHGLRMAQAIVQKKDVEEVVRCKDCKWVYRDEYSGCYFCHERQVRSDDFCSYGERKDNDST